MTPVDASLHAPDPKPLVVPKDVDGVVVNVRRVAQEPFYCMGLTRRILREETKTSGVGYTVFGMVAILADHLISGLMFQWNVLFHRLWTSSREAKGGGVPCDKPVESPAPPAPVSAPAPKAASAPNPLFAALLNAYAANPDESLEGLLAHKDVRETYKDIA